MELDANLADRYQPGGSLPPHASTYVVRQSDRELYEALVAGEYCYILNSRQMGKSSLRIRTMERLRADGIACAEIELSGIGSQQITDQQWYGGIIQELISGFGLTLNRRLWLKERDDLSPVQRLGEFIETVLLEQVSGHLVIFIDEIDSVLGLSFPTDDFFALLRNCYEKRATRPAYRCLAIALLGVATPADLIQDQHAAPFNIGRAIELRGLQLSECAPLATGLEQKTANPFTVLQEVLNWTGGQPFLTQKLCWMIASCEGTIPPGKEAEWVKQLVRSRIVHRWEAQDEPEHLRTIRDRILRSRHRVALLRLYRQILRQDVPTRHSPELVELRLTGLVIQRQGRFVAFNRIYTTIFDLEWIRQQADLQMDLPRWPRWSAIAAGCLVALGVIGGRSLGWLQPWELQTYDQLMRLRPAESPDPRLFLITITDADVQAQPAAERGLASLSEQSLSRLLARLDQGKPRVIGLDIYRDYAVKQVPGLVSQLQRDRLVVICYYGKPGTPPPPEVHPKNHGFNNVLVDADQVIRRHLLAVKDAQPCGNSVAFNFELAARYLEAQSIPTQWTTDQQIKIGSVLFSPVSSNFGGYRNLNASGHQIMLNYRATETIAESATLGDVLSSTFDPARVRDRLVMIGTVDQSFRDNNWRTPYSTGRHSDRTSAGVEIQAHMVSQILSAVLDRRPLIWSWPIWLESGWIIAWAVLSGVLVWYGRSFFKAAIVVIVTLMALYGVCLIVLVTLGGWLPLAPVTIAIVGTGVVNLALLQRK